MPPLIDGTVSTYGEEAEADRATRLADFVLDNARLVALLAVLATEMVWAAWLVIA